MESISLREAAGQAVLLAALLVAAFPGVFFRGEMISPADIAFQQPPWAAYAPADWKGPSNPLMADALTLFRPWYTTTRASVRAGAWPLWNPYEFAGIPLLANYQSAVFYPPRLLHVFLDVDVATTLCILLKLWLAGVAAYLCARTMRLQRPAAVFCSIGWMFSGYNLIWCNWSLPDLSPWLAILVLGSELLFQRRYQRGFFSIALGATLLLLAGHPVSAFTMTLGLGVYFVVRLSLDVRRGQAVLAPLGAWTGAWVLALLVCAALLLPFFEYLGNQYQGHDLAAFGAERGLPLSACAAFWVPRFFGTAADGNYWGELDSNRYSMIYPGVAVWLCAAMALYAWRARRSAGATAIALTAAAAFGIALAFEAYPFSILHGLPFFDAIKRSYHVCFAVFALPVLGAIGLDTWLRETRRSILLSPILLALAACVVVASVWQFNGGLIRMRELTAYLTVQTGLAAGFAVAGLALLASGALFQRKHLFGYALAALLAIDLLLAHRGLNPTIDRGHLMPETALTRYVQEHGLAERVGTAEGGVPGGLMAAYGIEEWLGEDGMYPERMLRFLKALGPDLWDTMEPACAIDCYLKHPAFTDAFPEKIMKRLQYRETLDGLEVYANEAAFPRAYLAPDVRVCPDRETMYSLMADPGFDPARTALLEAPLATPLPGTGQGTATVASHGFTEVVVETEADDAALLILADAYYPGWTATVNGTPAAIVPVYSVFRGVAVPEGRAEVRFTYFPATFRVGLACSVLSLAAGSIAGLLSLRRIRPRASQTPMNGAVELSRPEAP
ncbi:MAG TPA: YfhO family protein [Candidatus Hydrogenedentes bacterium]|nr:YfhO family protein [Candidatus Hydrogenedentota bacterium]